MNSVFQGILFFTEIWFSKCCFSNQSSPHLPAHCHFWWPESFAYSLLWRPLCCGTDCSVTYTSSIPMKYRSHKTSSPLPKDTDTDWLNIFLVYSSTLLEEQETRKMPLAFKSVFSTFWSGDAMTSLEMEVGGNQELYLITSATSLIFNLIHCSSTASLNLHHCWSV